MRLYKCYFYVFIVLFLIILFESCAAKFPKEKVRAEEQVSISYRKQDSTLVVQLTNQLDCPVQVQINSSVDIPWNSIQLEAKEDTLLSTKWEKKVPQITFLAEFGNPSLPIEDIPLHFPFTRNRDIKILQGYHGSFTHNRKTSKFALDFALPVGDTVLAASSGFVVEVIEEHKGGGPDPKFIENGNKILIFDPQSNRFFLYSHLKYMGSLVKRGDLITAGAPIGLSGNTGYSTRPHLHFAVMVAGKPPGGLESIPFVFEGGYDGKLFRKNSILPKL